MVTGPPGVDLERLTGWLDRHHVGTGPLAEPTLLTGGTQNILLRFGREGRAYVLRRPPVSKRANSDETMRREARVLAALAGTAVPHPRLVAAEPDADVLGAAFYVMDAVDGWNPSLGLVAAVAADPTQQDRIGGSMVDALLALAALDPAERGLADLGRTEGWVERQVPRWQRQLESYREIPGYAGPALPGFDEAAAWLGRHPPAAFRPALVHGDFHLANVLLEPDGPEVAAVLDWELATIGDARLDLAHLLVNWPGANASAVGVGVPGLPTVDELVDRYGARAPVEDLGWFRVLACVRLAAILEGTHARAGAGRAPVDVGDRLHAKAVDLLDHARHLIP